MQVTSMQEMFEKAFGLSLAKMKTGKAYNVSEANVGIMGVSRDGTQALHRVLYAVKKPKACRYKLVVEGLEPLVATKTHRIAVKDASTGLRNWMFADKLAELSVRGTSVVVETSSGPRKLLSAEKLDRDHTLDVQVEGSENYYSNGVLSHNCMYGPDFTTTGGRAIKYYASWRGRVTRIDDILEKGSLKGIVSKVRATKNKIGVNKREAELRLTFASGFDSEEEYLKFIIDLGIVTQRGAWFSQEDWGFKGSGRASLVEFLRGKPELFESVKNTVNAQLCSETSIDRANAANSSEEPDPEEEIPPDED